MYTVELPQKIVYSWISCGIYTLFSRLKYTTPMVSSWKWISTIGIKMTLWIVIFKKICEI